MADKLQRSCKMAQECTHDCQSCGKTCGERAQQADFSAKLNEHSKVGTVLAVASGKGGVGKSFVTSALAVSFMRKGLKVGILDADITGPSIPKAFGLAGGTYQSSKGIEPKVSKSGIRIISLNLLMENQGEPVVWRGPVIAGVVKQFWTDVNWGDLDVMVVDMPPGTGDVPLTVFQSLPVNGIVTVSTPQSLVEMIVSKSVRMAQIMNKPLAGLVENMSFLRCPDCGKEISVFGESKAAALAERFSIPAYARLPMDPGFAAKVDAGQIEDVSLPEMDEFAANLLGSFKA